MRLSSDLERSPTLELADAARARRARGEPILSLGLGEPDFPTPPALCEAVAEVLGEGNSGYTGALGVPALRERIADKLQRDNGIDVSASRTFVAAGAKQALSLALMAMLEPDDEIVILTPCFVSFVPQALIAEPRCRVVTVGIDAATHELDLERVAAAMNARTRAVLVNAPNNPVGYQLPDTVYEGLLELCRRHDAWLVSDEVYEKLVLDGSTPVSPGALPGGDERVVTINGFSKSHAMTGWRLGYAALPAALVPRVTLLQQHLNTNTATFVQKAVARAWDLECPHLVEYRRTLARRVALLGDWLERTLGIAGRLPEAGFFAFLDIGATGLRSGAFSAALLESTGVATTPGAAFGADWDDHVRLSFAVPDDTLVEALQRLGTFLQARSA